MDEVWPAHRPAGANDDMRIKRIGLLCLLAVILIVTTSLRWPGRMKLSHNRPPAGMLRMAYGKLPLSFEPNQGQTDRRVDYVARGKGYTLFLSPNEAVLSLSAGDSGHKQGPNLKGLMSKAGRSGLKGLTTASIRARKSKAEVVRVRIVGANPPSRDAASQT